jgi:integrase
MFVGTEVGTVKQLTALAISKIVKTGRYAVGDGAYLQVTGDTGRSWIFRYRDRRNGKPRHMGMGPCDLVTLAEAREKARTYRKLLLDGLDPLENKAAARQRAALEAARARTFKDCAEQFIAAHRSSWRNKEHGRQWTATLQQYAFPVLGEMSVADVDTATVLKVIEPIWEKKTQTASRVRNRIELILDWATVRNYREGDNPARWRGHLDKLLPKPSKLRKVRHHPALPYVDLPAVMAALRQQEGVPARALEFLVLTAARTGEAVGARWDEIKEGVWTIPAGRMKGEREHRVPLSERALAILEGLPRGDSGFVFPSKNGKQLYDKILQRETLPSICTGATVHGLRSTFRDWAAETTAYPGDVVEAALAHSIESKVEAAYRRGDLFEKRRQLMTDWAAYCASKPRAGADLVVQTRFGL